MTKEYVLFTVKLVAKTVVTDRDKMLIGLGNYTQCTETVIGLFFIDGQINTETNLARLQVM